jgi:hypothetical protein
MNGKQIVAAVVSAAASAATALGLFGAVLTDIAPPTSDVRQVANFAAMGATALLLLVSAIVPKLMSGSSRLWIAGVAAALLLTAFGTYFSLRADVSKYVYAYPPDALQDHQRRYIRGEYHEHGARMAQGLSPAAAVARAGGPSTAERHEVLWSNASRSEIEGMLVRKYISVVALATAALFLAAFASIAPRK